MNFSLSKLSNILNISNAPDLVIYAGFALVGIFIMALTAFLIVLMVTKARNHQVAAAKEPKEPKPPKAKKEKNQNLLLEQQNTVFLFRILC